MCPHLRAVCVCKCLHVCVWTCVVCICVQVHMSAQVRAWCVYRPVYMHARMFACCVCVLHMSCRRNGAHPETPRAPQDASPAGKQKPAAVPRGLALGLGSARRAGGVFSRRRPSIARPGSRGNRFLGVLFTRVGRARAGPRARLRSEPNPGCGGRASVVPSVLCPFLFPAVDTPGWEVQAPCIETRPLNP